MLTPMSLWYDPFVITSWLSSSSCHRPTMDISCSPSGISHISKEPWLQKTFLAYVPVLASPPHAPLPKRGRGMGGWGHRGEGGERLIGLWHPASFGPSFLEGEISLLRVPAYVPFGLVCALSVGPLVLVSPSHLYSQPRSLQWPAAHLGQEPSGGAFLWVLGTLYLRLVGYMDWRLPCRLQVRLGGLQSLYSQAALGSPLLSELRGMFSSTVTPNPRTGGTLGMGLAQQWRLHCSGGWWFLDVCSTARTQEGQKGEWQPMMPTLASGNTFTKALQVDAKQSRWAGEGHSCWPRGFTLLGLRLDMSLW